MMTDNKVEYIQAYTEVICLLKYFPKEYIDKLPNKLLEMIQNRSDRKYNINVDVKKDLESQNISKKTKDILVVLKYNYWSTDDEKKYLRKKFYENELAFQDEISKKYNTDNLFKNKTSNKKIEISENVSMVEYKETWFSKILNKIKIIFNR